MKLEIVFFLAVAIFVASGLEVKNIRERLQMLRNGKMDMKREEDPLMEFVNFATKCLEDFPLDQHPLQQGIPNEKAFLKYLDDCFNANPTNNPARRQYGGSGSGGKSSEEDGEASSESGGQSGSGAGAGTGGAGGVNPIRAFFAFAQTCLAENPFDAYKAEADPAADPILVFLDYVDECSQTADDTGLDVLKSMNLGEVQKQLLRNMIVKAINKREMFARQPGKKGPFASDSTNGPAAIPLEFRKFVRQCTDKNPLPTPISLGEEVETVLDFLYECYTAENGEPDEAADTTTPAYVVGKSFKKEIRELLNLLQNKPRVAH